MKFSFLYYQTKKINIPVIVTQGIPAPYDAWSTIYKGEQAFFFNLDLWTKENLKRSGLAVVKHEITHVLLHDLLKEPNESNDIDVLEHIIVNEGLAHYIGFPRDRTTLLTEHIDKWEPAEKKYSKAIKEISLKTTEKARIEKLIHDSNTGKFWDKFGAISGMFRFAKIHKEEGVEGIVKCIKNSKVPAKFTARQVL